LTQVRHVAEILESWAPKAAAWERDNIGLLAGSATANVKKILVALDCTQEVVAEATRTKADLLITHHPLIFRPVSSVTDRDRVGALLTSLIRAKISLYAAHTNLDFTRTGVSYVLAQLLGIKEPQVLHPSENLYKKIAVFVPEDYLGRVMEAMSAAGAGRIGNYDSCSYLVIGTGTFRPLADAKPFIGSKDRLERVVEVRLEMIALSWKVRNVLEAMRSVHPYESVAYDVYPLENTADDFGAGAIGDLEQPVTLNAFLATVKQRLKAKAIRYSGKTSGTIRRVAVCGGSGSDLLPVAIHNGADALVTADVKYHAFQDAEQDIVLIDAGHYETEVPVVSRVAEYLTREFKKRGEPVQVRAARSSRNPVHYV